MATTTNYAWETPDDTDLVKDGAAAIRTLGSSIDTTTKALNPSTTLGDIEYRSSTANTNTRLGIGSTGQILTVSGGVPTWATPSGAANFALVNTGGTALTGAAVITVSGISGKSKIMLVITGAGTNDSYSEMQIQLNGDTGSNYNYYGTRQAGSATYAPNVFTGVSGVNQTSIPTGTLSAVSTSRLHGTFMFDGCNTSGVKTFSGAAGGTASGDNGQQSVQYGGFYNSTSTISSISLRSSAGNFNNGTLFVYASA